MTPKTEFANEKDVFDYINGHKLKLVVFDYHWFYWRTVFLVFEDNSYMRLYLKNCQTAKLFGWKYYDGEITVEALNGIKCNYKILLTNTTFRNKLIDGIEAETKRLKNRAAEVFTNEVRNDKNNVYDYLTKIGDVFFHYHKDCGNVKHHFNPNDYNNIIPTP